MTYNSPPARDLLKALGSTLSERLLELTKTGMVSGRLDVLEELANDAREIETFLAEGDVDLEHLSKADLAILLLKMLCTPLGEEAVEKLVHDTVAATRDAIAQLLMDRATILPGDDGIDASAYVSGLTVEELLAPAPAAVASAPEALAAKG